MASLSFGREDLLDTPQVYWFLLVRLTMKGLHLSHHQMQFNQIPIMVKSYITSITLINRG